MLLWCYAVGLQLFSEVNHKVHRPFQNLIDQNTVELVNFQGRTLSDLQYYETIALF